VELGFLATFIQQLTRAEKTEFDFELFTRIVFSISRVFAECPFLSLRRIFRLCDSNHDGYLTLEEMLCFSSLFFEKDNDRKIQLLFRALDFTSQGSLDSVTLSAALRFVSDFVGDLSEADLILFPQMGEEHLVNNLSPRSLSPLPQVNSISSPPSLSAPEISRSATASDRISFERFKLIMKHSRMVDVFKVISNSL
jgi:hypothetical protein